MNWMFWRPKAHLVEVDYDAPNALKKAALRFDQINESTAKLSELKPGGSGKDTVKVFEIRFRRKRIRLIHLTQELNRLGKKYGYPEGFVMADPLTYLNFILQRQKKLRKEQIWGLLNTDINRAAFYENGPGKWLRLSSMITFGSEGPDGDPKYWPLELFVSKSSGLSPANRYIIPAMPTPVKDQNFDQKFMRDMRITAE